MFTGSRFKITKLNLKLRHNKLKTGTADISNFSFFSIPKILYLWVLHHDTTQMNNFKVKSVKWGLYEALTKISMKEAHQIFSPIDLQKYNPSRHTSRLDSLYQQQQPSHSQRESFCQAMCKPSLHPSPICRKSHQTSSRVTSYLVPFLWWIFILPMQNMEMQFIGFNWPSFCMFFVSSGLLLFARTAHIVYCGVFSTDSSLVKTSCKG